MARRFVTLVCPPGAESAPISHGAEGFEAYREHGHGGGRWLVDVPIEAVDRLTRVGGFRMIGDTSYSQSEDEQ